MKGVYFILLLLFFNSLNAQVGLEQWREHLPYGRTIAVSEGEKNIYCATPYSAFYYDKEEDILKRMTTINGLSDVNISSIAYSKRSKCLVIAYENANLDLVFDNEIYNISDIKRKSMVGSKKINKIIFKEDLIYLACDFGIVVINPDRKEIKDTYYIGPEGKAISILDLTYDDSLFYAATDEGIFFADVNNKNLNNYQSWTKNTNNPHPNSLYNSIAIHHNKLYINKPGSSYNTDTTYVLYDNKWEKFDRISNEPTYQIKSYGDTLIFAQEYNFTYFYNNLSKSFVGYTYGEKSPLARDIIIDKKGELWIADKEEGLVHSEIPWNYVFYKPDGPARTSAYSMTYGHNRLWVAGGGTTGTWAAAGANNGIYEFKNQRWTSHNSSTNLVFDTIVDFLKIAINPSNPEEIFVGTWGDGILKIKNGEVIQIFDESNSSLSEAINYPGFVGVAGLAFDQQNYLWVTNTTNTNALSFKRPDNVWRSLSLSPYITDQTVGDLIIDDYGQKWIILPRGNGILVYNDNNTPEISADDRKKKLNTSDNNGKLPSNGVNCLIKDKEGSIWVGTDKGVAVFYTPELVFSQYNFDAQQIYVEQEGISQYLLESEIVTSIAIDGANRKWFGTRNAGVFLMSDDGTELIYHFSRDNSPLLSDNIYSIAVDKTNGEVFFGTENGIISFRSTATEGTEKQESNVKVFPNPVRPEYNGKIAISGLVENADVKITDSYGNLVYQTNALGGQAVWNGKNFNGERVASGVYLVYSTNTDEFTAGEQTVITKILFIK